ncbi:hypothetical protein [Noviherbaspirillum malthae]|uniref:hypothetical protein n=1 Tax=Noviherbaspirillum malthae TaxID=1260987 RepID=UPI00188E203E|nr:hypothetical protein [Noviherbaspirillum malthae]
MQGNAVKAHASLCGSRKGNKDMREANEGDSLPAGESRMLRFHARHQYTRLAALRRRRQAGYERYWILNLGLAVRREKPPCGQSPTSETIIDQIRIIRNNFDDKKLSLCLQLRTAMQLAIYPRSAFAETAIILKELNRTHVFRKMKLAILPLSWRHRPPLTLSTRIPK